jgi:transposase
MLSHAVYSEAATGRGQPTMTAAQWRSTRWALRTGENKLTDDKRALINQIARTNWHIGRAWTLKEQLRDLYRIDHPPGGARRHLRRWITAAKRSRINAFVALAKRRQVYFEQIITANRRHQRQNPAHQCPRLRPPLRPALTSMIYLTCGGLRPKLPTQT